MPGTGPQCILDGWMDGWMEKVLMISEKWKFIRQRDEKVNLQVHNQSPILRVLS